MKLLVMTSIRSFKKEIKTILKKAEVKAYSYKDVIGYRDASELSIKDNWFTNDMNEGEAVLFYAIVNDVSMLNATVARHSVCDRMPRAST